MADIRPFHAIRYAERRDLPLSDLIAPPYDVLDEAKKKALQARHPNNIVTVDLPFLPPKKLGPDSAYEGAAATLRAWLDAGIMKRDRRPAMYPYTQTFQHHGKTFHRRGFICLVKLTPFGVDVIPHEKTYDGPIEDRLQLMHATGCQLSPVFGLFNDTRNEVNGLLYGQVGKPQMTATVDGITHHLWSVIDAEIERKVIDILDDRKVYIADGHHRYTTALHYQRQMEERYGRPLPPAHPANYCMFTLVPMSDDGLVILPTHRLLELSSTFSIDIFRAKTAGIFDVTPVEVAPENVGKWVEEELPRTPLHTFALYDAATKKLYRLVLAKPDPLGLYEPGQSEAWRRLDVAMLQRYLIDEIFRPHFNGGNEVMRDYTSDSSQIVPLTDGRRNDVALILRATPLHSLEELGKTGETMPQKSTFFYPKLATGMTVYSLVDENK